MQHSHADADAHPNAPAHHARFHPFNSALATIALGVALTVVLNVALHWWMG